MSSRKNNLVIHFVEACIVTKNSGEHPKDFQVTVRSVVNPQTKIGYQLCGRVLKVFQLGNEDVEYHCTDDELKVMEYVYDKTSFT